MEIKKSIFSSQKCIILCTIFEILWSQVTPPDKHRPAGGGPSKLPSHSILAAAAVLQQRLQQLSRCAYAGYEQVTLACVNFRAARLTQHAML